MLKLAGYFSKFIQTILSTNEYHLNTDEQKPVASDDLNISALLRVKPAFDRQNLEKNSYLLIELNPKLYMYIHEKNFNLVIYMMLLIVDVIGNEPGENTLEPEFWHLFKDIYTKKQLFYKVSLTKVYFNFKNFHLPNSLI